MDVKFCPLPDILDGAETVAQKRLKINFPRTTISLQVRKPDADFFETVEKRKANTTASIAAAMSRFIQFDKYDYWKLYPKG